MGDPSVSTTDSVTPRLPRAERRAQLVEAAAAAFLLKGFDATSMEAVAERAGVTRLIVYRHFDRKEDLYRAVLSSATELFRAQFDGARPANVTVTLLEVARARPDAFRLLWRHARHQPAFAAEAEMFRLVAADYAEAVVGHRVDPAYRRWAASAVVEHLHEGICTWLDDGDPERDDDFAARLRDGVRAFVVAWAG